MSNLPELDPLRLYERSRKEIERLYHQNLQMDVLIDVLVEERDKALQERDKAQYQVAELTAALAAHRGPEQPDIIQGEEVVE